MLTITKKHTIIELKLKGKGYREINRITGISRRIIEKYWEQYKKQQNELKGAVDLEDLFKVKQGQEEIISKPKYDSVNVKEENLQKRLKQGFMKY